MNEQKIALEVTPKRIPEKDVKVTPGQIVPFNHKAHKALWNWLAENPEKVAADWPEWEYQGGTCPDISNWCFACEYASQFRVGIGRVCNMCPLENARPNGHCGCLNGKYDDYVATAHSVIFDMHSKIAETIRDWPLRKGVVILDDETDEVIEEGEGVKKHDR